MQQIDSYAHILPRAYFDRMAALAKDKGAIKRWLNIPVLYDLDARIKMMERHPEYQQVLNLPLAARPLRIVPILHQTGVLA